MTTNSIRNFFSTSAIAGIATLVSLSAVPAFAGTEPGYSHESFALFPNTSWMSNLPDSLKLSHMSIPGTHDSMAHVGGDSVQTQTMDLSTQLFAGIRMFDIRIMFEFNTFGLSHGVIPQPGNFDGVMQAVSSFLQSNPREMVLMRVKDEYDGLGNTVSFEDAFKVYWNRYSNVFWRNPTGTTNPTLGELRGKVVVLQNFAGNDSYGLSYGSLYAQDNYNLTTNWDLYNKWTDVKNQLVLANTVAGTQDRMYINFLSGATGAFPYFVASGKSSSATDAPLLSTGETTPAYNNWPDFPRTGCFIGICTISFEGTNNLTYNWLTQAPRTRTGIIMADFPGPGLIEAVAAVNKNASSF
jgi:1-phosphatidylinositol phosphodiesterase